ncbi:MAG: methyltransferase domain-containing protein [Ideonella sp.]|nr:methyltransferase domain-containing protein [Ideonella sp.]
MSLSSAQAAVRRRPPGVRSDPCNRAVIVSSSAKPPRDPDRAAALSQYRRRAGIYDLELALFEPLRRKAVDRLALQRGETVLDVGCGTGLSLALLKQGVGASGHIIGIEQSPEMIARARARVAQHRYRHVRLLCAPAEEAPIVGLADAALFHFTHDILRRPEALHHVLQHLKPGARVVATGLQWAAVWALPVNLAVLGAALRSVSSLQGLRRPWSLLAQGLEAVEVQSLMLGAVFLAEGSCPMPAPALG